MRFYNPVAACRRGIIIGRVNPKSKRKKEKLKMKKKKVKIKKMKNENEKRCNVNPGHVIACW